jgi:hypothetical protein
MPTTQLYSYSHYANTSEGTIEGDVQNYLGDHEADYDIPGLTDAYRDTINANLEQAGSSARLHGDEFYSNHPTPDYTDETIRDAIQDVGLGTLAQKYDRTV